MYHLDFKRLIKYEMFKIKYSLDFKILGKNSLTVILVNLLVKKNTFTP